MNFAILLFYTISTMEKYDKETPFTTRKTQQYLPPGKIAMRNKKNDSKFW